MTCDPEIGDGLSYTYFQLSGPGCPGAGKGVRDNFVQTRFAA